MPTVWGDEQQWPAGWPSWLRWPWTTRAQLRAERDRALRDLTARTVERDRARQALAAVDSRAAEAFGAPLRWARDLAEADALRGPQ